MQLNALNTMDCSVRSSQADSDLGDDLSHEDHSDDEMRECDSIEGDHVNRTARLNHTITSNGGDMSFSGGGSGGIGGIGIGRSPESQAEMQLSHHHQFTTNPLNALGNFMGIGGLHGIPNLQHNDVLEKLKMQVRDMKVGLMEQDYAAHAAAFGANVLPTPINTAFTLPPTTIASFGHAAPNIAPSAGNSMSNGNLGSQNSTSTSATSSALSNGGNSFSFTSPTAPSSRDVNPASNSSTSSEASNSSQQNNGWSFEEQYKQVRQLYEINDDPKRKEFLDDLFSFMQKRGTPINRLPIMAKSVLDLYELYNLVIARGGLVDVINKKLWQEIIKGLHLPSSITSAAFTLRTQYMKYLYPYECEKKNLSSPAELQAAIDGNRREGRRSSYGQYEAMHNQMQMPQMARPLSGGMQQMSPLALVTHAASAAANQQAQAAAAAAAAHHRLMAPTFGQMPNIVTHEIEKRMMEYINMMQGKKDQSALGANAGINGSGSSSGTPHQQPQQQRQRSQSPEITTREALNALEMSRVALWQMYHNNTSPPASVNASPQGAAEIQRVEPQREALNLSDSPPNLTSIKREREPSQEREEFHHQPPPPKRVDKDLLRGGIMPSGFPASFYLPHGMAAAAAAANFHHSTHRQDSDVENEDELDEEGEHNTTVNSSNEDQERQRLNGHHHHHHHHNSNASGVITDKSDDSAIENSPSTSASAGNGHLSPVTTKKALLTKTQQSNLSETNASTSNKQISALETLSLLSGLQFQVTRNGTNENGEQQLIVNLELNGMKYSGVLVTNTTTATSGSSIKSSTTANITSSPSSNKHGKKRDPLKQALNSSLHSNKDNSESLHAKDDDIMDEDMANELTEADADTETLADAVIPMETTPPKAKLSATTAIAANGGNNVSATIQDALITT
ncbi:protein dead ringer-like isoform X2 [Teleopsis dalmanni]|uniref:protein dead ringer-like isoform X2 n=1 Tax=Teleopsis dalmanni TaxID=139649 RepID=UPI0018CF073E|nr:protein dead ringer-like isoform X2 [Teleopsis dalmanni]